MTYDYYDEDYFQNGERKGTAYSNYLAASRSSAIYFEIALAISKVFNPRRVLEIGCATGIVVKHLNDMDIEAHGIDVSSWAIKNREHHNVTLAGAEKIPYPDEHFDLVYSIHALEHIPQNLKDAAFSEIKRVSKKNQLHLLPIIGLGPYAGERDDVISALKKDPTHSLLEDREWWLREFNKIGFSDLNTSLTFFNETNGIDLGESQLLLIRDTPDPEMQRRLRTWNSCVLNKSLAETIRLKSKPPIPLSTSDWVQSAHLSLNGDWGDITLHPVSLNLCESQSFVASVTIRSAEKVPLRFCLVSTDGCEADIWREYYPGMTNFEFTTNDLSNRRGQISGKDIAKILFGGKANATINLTLACKNFIKK